MLTLAGQISMLELYRFKDRGIKSKTKQDNSSFIFDKLYMIFSTDLALKFVSGYSYLDLIFITFS